MAETILQIPQAASPRRRADISGQPRGSRRGSLHHRVRPQDRPDDLLRHQLSRAVPATRAAWGGRHCLSCSLGRRIAVPHRCESKLSTGWGIWSDNWVGLTQILVLSVICPLVAFWQNWPGRVVEHTNLSQCNPDARAEALPCIFHKSRDLFPSSSSVSFRMGFS